MSESLADDLLELVVRRILMFSLNPLTFLSEMTIPLQTFLDDFTELCYNRSELFNPFVKWFFRMRQRPRPPLSWKFTHKRPREFVESGQTKWQRTEQLPSMKLEGDIMEETTGGWQFTTVIQKDVKPFPDVRLTSDRYVQLCPGTHFLRVYDEGEDYSVQTFVNTHYKVKVEKADELTEEPEDGIK